MQSGELDVMVLEDALVRVIRIFAARGRAIREARERDNLIGKATTTALESAAKSDSLSVASPCVTALADNSAIGPIEGGPEEETDS